MSADIKHNGNSCTLTGLGIARESGSGLLIPMGEVLTVCAWCDQDKDVTNRLKQAGYKVSHGVCQKCSGNFLAAPKPTYAQMVETRALANRLAEKLGCRPSSLELRVDALLLSIKDKEVKLNGQRKD